MLLHVDSMVGPGGHGHIVTSSEWKSTTVRNMESEYLKSEAQLKHIPCRTPPRSNVRHEKALDRRWAAEEAAVRPYI